MGAHDGGGRAPALRGAHSGRGDGKKCRHDWVREHRDYRKTLSELTEDPRGVAMGTGHTEGSVQQEGACVRHMHCVTGEETPVHSQLAQAGFLVWLLPWEPCSPRLLLAAFEAHEDKQPVS